MATIHEVARRAGVSITTVSHVYSGKRPVAPETKERVLRAADALEYRPNRTARGLATGRAMTFGLHVPPEGDDQGSFQELLISRGVDGVIVADPESSDPVIPGLVDAEVPVITIGRYLPDPGLPWVDNDHARALHDLFAHLDEQGYERFALLSTRGAISYFRDVEATYTREAEGRDMPMMIQRTPDLSEEEAHRQAVRLLDRPDPPDVIIASVDRQAIGVLRAADELGIQVPQELGVAGEGDTVLAEHARPPLTSIRVHPGELGATAVESLLRLVEGEQVDDRLPPAEVAPRKSTRRTDRPPSGDAAG